MDVECELDVMDLWWNTLDFLNPAAQTGWEEKSCFIRTARSQIIHLSFLISNEKSPKSQPYIWAMIEKVKQSRPLPAEPIPTQLKSKWR